ncbi:MAG TPA: hypothetical protein VMH23_04440, partial [Bacteroidota bacterium]|nr:hypothetical protein [Bacteroidota bacterium]
SSTQSPTYRRLMNDVINKMLKDPLVRVDGSQYVHVIVRNKGTSTYVHLINTGGAHFNRKVFTYNEVVPLGQLSVRIHHEVKPRIVTLQPGNTPLHYTYAEGIISVSVPTLDIHSIIEVSD